VSYLTEFAARQLLGECGLALPRAHLARTEAQAQQHAKKIGYPVVLKLMSRDILHKSDAGGVKVVQNRPELSAAFSQILKNAKKYNPSARIDGILVEEQLSGMELVIGAKKDAQFGHVIVFGIGGVFVELMKDISIRLVPISRNDAKAMIGEIKGHKMLLGYRGKKPVNLAAVQDALLSVSKMVAKHPEIHELDINPLFADERGVIVGDARIALG